MSRFIVRSVTGWKITGGLTLGRCGTSYVVLDSAVNYRSCDEFPPDHDQHGHGKQRAEALAARLNAWDRTPPPLEST